MKTSKKVFFLVIILLFFAFCLFADDAEDFIGVWILDSPNEEFDPFIPNIMTISIVEGKYFVVSNNCFVDEDGTILAEISHGFYVLKNNKLIRETESDIAEYFIDPESNILQIDFIFTIDFKSDPNVRAIGFDSDPIFYRKATISDFSESINFYKTKLE